NGKSYTGHKIQFSAKSVASAYLRTWGLGAGVGGVVMGLAGAIPLLFVGLLLLGAAGLSWRWKKASPRELERREMFAAAAGTFCDPDRMPDEMALALRENLAKVWGARFPDTTPNDVARFGAKEPRQAAMAYAMLRLSAREVDA